MTAVVAGTFDPFTTGHAKLVEKASRIFDGVVVAVAEECGKSAASMDDRIRIAKNSLNGFVGVSVVGFDGLLTEFLKTLDGAVLLRGIRNSVDLEYERELCKTYSTLDENIKIMHVLCEPEYAHISSSVVRSLAKLGAPLNGFVESSAEKDVQKVYGR